MGLPYTWVNSNPANSEYDFVIRHRVRIRIFHSKNGHCGRRWCCFPCQHGGSDRSPAVHSGHSGKSTYCTE